MLKWTLKNIICISEPLDRGHKPPVKSTLESRHFSAVAFWGVRTMGVAGIIIESHPQDYTVYSTTIRRRPATPDRKCTRGQALLRGWISGGVHYGCGWYYC